jgi:phosphatidate cytidylyltransferase
MSGASHIEAKPAPANDFRRRFQFNIDWVLRPLFGFALAGLAVWSTIHGGLVFVVFVALGCTVAVGEWHRLFAKRDYLLPATITVAAMLSALLWQLYATSPDLRFVPITILSAAAAANLVVGVARRELPVAHAVGPLYIALPALSLLMVRQSPEHPVWLVVLTLLAVWATDTGALLSGKLIGGAKLAPQLSPNKTWAGSAGGLVCAAIVCGALALYLHTSIVAAALFAIVLSVAGQLGDLFESLVKRQVGCKDSGHLIPGHGGALDRIDSILFAAPMAALMILAMHFDPFAGLHP